MLLKCIELGRQSDIVIEDIFPGSSPTSDLYDKPKTKNRWFNLNLLWKDSIKNRLGFDLVKI